MCTLCCLKARALGLSQLLGRNLAHADVVVLDRCRLENALLADAFDFFNLFDGLVFCLFRFDLVQHKLLLLLDLLKQFPSHASFLAGQGHCYWHCWLLFTFDAFHFKWLGKVASYWSRFELSAWGWLLLNFCLFISTSDVRLKVEFHRLCRLWGFHWLEACPFKIRHF
jgi:hypothetical protein